MIVLGLRNLFRSKLRLAVVVILIAVPFFLLLVMKAIGDDKTASCLRISWRR